MKINHNFFSNLAFNLAESHIGKTGTNPSVGCIVVKNKSVISSGVTSFSGRPHAEFNALSKLKRKNCDLIIANDISKKDSGFNSDYNRISIIDNNGKIKIIKKSRKSFIANKIVEFILGKLLVNDRNFN